MLGPLGAPEWGDCGSSGSTSSSAAGGVASSTSSAVAGDARREKTSRSGVLGYETSSLGGVKLSMGMAGTPASTKNS